MALAGSVLVKFRADYAEWVSGTQKVRTDAKRTNEEIAEGAKKTAAKTKSSYGKMLTDLNDSFGKRSALGKTLKLFAGAGVIGGLGLAASQFDELTKKAEALTLAIHQGDGEARKQTAEFLTSLPVVGKLADGFSRIYELISGTTTYVADTKVATEATNAVTDAMTVRLKMAKENAKELSEHVQGLFDHINAIIRRGVPLKLFEIDKETRDSLAKINEETEKKQKGPDLEGLRKKAADLQSKIINTPPQQVLGKFWGNFLGFGTPQTNFKQIAQLQATRASVVREIKKTEADIENTAFFERMAARAKGLADKAVIYASMASDKFRDFFKELKEAQPQPTLRFDLWTDGLKQAGNVFDRLSTSIKSTFDHQRDWIHEAGELYRDAMTPIEKYRERVKDIQSHTGFLGLSQKDAAILKGKAFAELRAAEKAPAIEAIERRSAFTTHNDELKNPLDKIAADTAKEPPLLDKILTAVGQLNIGSVVVSLPGV
jgi:hypothetical protein